MSGSATLGASSGAWLFPMCEKVSSGSIPHYLEVTAKHYFWLLQIQGKGGDKILS